MRVKYQIPKTIFDFIPEEDMIGIQREFLETSIGNNSIIHSHNTLPSMAQKYNLPMWKLPKSGVLEPEDSTTISGNRGIYEETQQSYHTFALDLIDRLRYL